MKKIAVVWCVAVILIAINIFYYWVRPNDEHLLSVFGALLTLICAVLACLGLASGATHFRPFDIVKMAWLLLLGGMLLFLSGQAAYAILGLLFQANARPAFPSIADFLYMAAFPFLFSGLMVIIYGYRKSGFPVDDTKAYSLLGAFTIGGTIILLRFLFIPILFDNNISATAKFVYIFYPLGDILLIILALALIHITSLFGKGQASSPWKYIALGSVALTVCDIVYTYLKWSGQYGIVNYIDIGRNAGYLLIGIGGFIQGELLKPGKTEVRQDGVQQ